MGSDRPQKQAAESLRERKQRRFENQIGTYNDRNINDQNTKEKLMTMPVSQLIQKSMLRILTVALLSSLVIATPLLAAEKPAHHTTHEAPAPATLVTAVRNGTRQYINVNNAVAAG